MATQSVAQNRFGPLWPLGFISVVTPGTPVNIMSLVDPTSINAPETAGTTAGTSLYVPTFQQLMFFGYKPNTHGLQNNTGNVYLMLNGKQGAGNRDDYGAMVNVFFPGGFFVLASAPAVVNVFSPYQYSLDADNAGDGCLVVGIVQ